MPTAAFTSSAALNHLPCVTEKDYQPLPLAEKPEEFSVCLFPTGKSN